MNTSVIISSMEMKERAKFLVDKLPFSTVHEVAIRPHKVDRSLQQNAYYWKILTVVGKDLGMTKEEVHTEYKRRFLKIIFERDNEDYAAMIQAVREVREERLDLQAEALEREVIRLTSTRDASVKQMSEYLDDIQHHAASLGIRLPAPEYDK